MEYLNEKDEPKSLYKFIINIDGYILEGVYIN